MYNTACDLNDLFKELALFALLNDLSYKLADKTSNDYGICLEFVDILKYKPDTVKLLMEEYKRTFLYEVADSPEKPVDWSPKEYYEYYIKTYNFIQDQRVLAPLVEDEDWIRYDTKYGINIEIIELILCHCFHEIFSNDFFAEEFDKHYNSIKNKKSFKQACQKNTESLRYKQKCRKIYRRINSLG